MPRNMILHDTYTRLSLTNLFSVPNKRDVLQNAEEFYRNEEGVVTWTLTLHPSMTVEVVVPCYVRDILVCSWCTGLLLWRPRLFSEKSATDATLCSENSLTQWSLLNPPQHHICHI